MVDWQFTVFCREVGFVEIYAFLVLIFLAKIVSAFFITFCISAAIISAIAGGNLLIISASNLAYQQYYEYSPVPFALLVVMGTTMLIVAIISVPIILIVALTGPKIKCSSSDVFYSYLRKHDYLHSRTIL